MFMGSGERPTTRQMLALEDHFFLFFFLVNKPLKAAYNSPSAAISYSASLKMNKEGVLFFHGYRLYALSPHVSKAEVGEDCLCLTHIER